MKFARFRIVWRPSADRSLALLRAPIQRHIRQAVRELADDPLPAGSEPMYGKARGCRRLRIGDYRVVYHFREESRSILIIRVGGRGIVYSGLEPYRGD